MLVKVVLSYYMEGEHSQGANQSKGVWSGGEWSLLKGGGRGAAGHVLTCGRVAVLGPLRGPARKTRRTLARRALLCCRAERRRREDRSPDADWCAGVEEVTLGAGTAGNTWRRLRPGRPLPTERRLGDGWPPQVRAVDAPAPQDVPA